MVELIIDTNADIDVLLRELQRLKRTQTTAAVRPAAALSWADIYADPTLVELFQERLSSVMSAAKNQRVIHFPRERLLIDNNGDAEVELLAPHLRILPESAIHSRSKQEERRADFKEAKLKALKAHKEKMLQLALQRIELLGSAGGSSCASTGAAAEGAETGVDMPPATPLDVDGEKASTEAADEESEGSAPPPPPPPPADSDDDDSASEGADMEGDDDDDPPPPPPLEDDDDDNASERTDTDGDNDDDPPPPPPPPPPPE
ncbi:hypothetical protein TraAM80_01936 [Trypanosoma rangeli]|uniref:Uncharacterized protein n=1 Tax=Trypanosoma rangeli TaxID=5698 RepID=A0A3R7L9L0_TRYRA|nr:uncharacterized protein TraAM80_01936 [Trypanosoma rangeli]RNF09802.1 hypothetical protein TraAM80_01936 [Trypanosoma rangeli]|eukprot:RNF09802.1 hypothetical protein TraAM80_01936 [Trypanosoma rangeli]